jgi:Transglutaminase-like superfamily
MRVNPAMRLSSVWRAIRTKWRSVLILFERSRPVVESWLLLLFFECVMRLRSSTALRKIVRTQKIHPKKIQHTLSGEQLSHAMDLACVFYFRKVLCLQRSAATTILFRRYGRTAEIVIGAQILPYEFHAWVESGGLVVNDKPYMREIYQVLEH